MGDDLQDKPRKELKELCSRNNIRTAGVKHEDLVRLLRNKLYPAAPSTPRSKSARGPKEPSPGKDSYKTPVVTKARSARTQPSLPREVQKEFQRKNSGLSRKPLLTKSNTFSPRSRASDGRVAADQHQENAYRRPVASKVKGLSPLSRGRCVEAPGQLETSTTTETTPTMSLPQTSEKGDDSGSDASRRVSEVATDAGPDTMSDFSDADEFRSVSSEPISRLSSRRSSGLRTETSKMSLLSAQSGLSFFTADSWGSENSQSLDNLLLDARQQRGDAADDVFPEFPDGSNFLADALEVSFLDAGAADPELAAMHSPMARDYVNYSRGSETIAPENPTRLSIASDSRDMVDGETPVPSDLAPDTPCEDDHQSKSADADVDTPTQSEPDDDASRDLGTQPTPEDEGEASGSPAFDTPTQSELDDGASRDVGTQPTPEDEAHTEGEEASGSPAFDTPTQSERDDGASRDIRPQPTPEDAAHTEGEEASGSPAFDTPTQSERDGSASRDVGPQPIPEDEARTEGEEASASDSPDDGATQLTPESNEVLEAEESASPANFDYSDVAKKLEFEPVEITSSLHNGSQKMEPAAAAHVPVETVDPLDSSPTNTQEKPDSPVDEREGLNSVKFRDEHCEAVVHEYNKPSLEDGREEEPLSFPLSVLLWCTQSCSSTSGSRSQTLAS